MAPNAVLVDTGPLVSIIRTSQPHHAGCVEVLNSLSPPLLTCLPVVTETAYLLRKRPEQVQKLLEGFDTGLLQLLPIDESDIPAIKDIIHQYADQDFDFADACLMHLGDRESMKDIFTRDSDFRVYRPADGQPFSIVPIIGANI